VAGMDLGKHWQLWMGVVIVIAALVLPKGLIGLGAELLKRKGGTHG
jgi:branched-chain amino acid transport system permease protein